MMRPPFGIVGEFRLKWRHELQNALRQPVASGVHMIDANQRTDGIDQPSTLGPRATWFPKGVSRLPTAG